MQIKQASIFYSGIVQGVGFRYQSRTIALSMNIRGWVRNLPDGRVEIVAQAQKSDLDDFINALDASFVGYIKNRQVCWQDADETVTGFNIIF
ncbi:MAG: acylphosphatase [Candidatus Omnitrophica bacterium]|nr:acylphosphatase [Candidatus Omnitrophota bacterium]